MAKYNVHRLGIDMDGVILDHTENKLRIFRKMGIELSPQETASDIAKKKVAPRVWDEIQAVLYDDPVVSFSAPVMAGALDALQFFRKNGIAYFLISRRRFPEGAIKILRARGLWGPYFDAKNAFFAQTKKEKGDKARELGISLYIDDQPSVLDEMPDVRQRILFDPVSAYRESAYPHMDSWKSAEDILLR